MKATCDAHLKSYRHGARRTCGATAVHDISGFGLRCRRHAPTGAPCPACNRLQCRVPLASLTCVFAAYRHRFEREGWARCSEHSQNLRAAGVTVLYVPHGRSYGAVYDVPYAPHKWPAWVWINGERPSPEQINAAAVRPNVDDLDAALDRVQAFMALRNPDGPPAMGPR